MPLRRSKGVWASSDVLITAGLIYLTIKIVPFLAGLASVAVATTATAQVSNVIPSRLVKVVEFDDRGRVYRVDLESGRVTFTDGSAPQPEPTKPEPPKPEPTPQLTGLALRVNEWFRAKVTTRQAETAAELAQVIETTLAITGGLGLKGQQILDELGKQIDAKGLRPRLAGFPLGDALKLAVGDDPAKIVPALRDAKVGLEAVR